MDRHCCAQITLSCNLSRLSAGSFTGFNIETPLISSTLGQDVMLVCNVSYPTNEERMGSMPTIVWTIGPAGVDLSNQSSQDVDVYFESVLNLMSVDSSHCGDYTCSANDDRIAQPVTGTANLQVGKSSHLTN